MKLIKNIKACKPEKYITQKPKNIALFRPATTFEFRTYFTRDDVHADQLAREILTKIDEVEKNGKHLKFTEGFNGACFLIGSNKISDNTSYWYAVDCEWWEASETNKNITIITALKREHLDEVRELIRNL